jgi:transposase
MRRVELSEDEKELLKNYCKTSPIELMRAKAQAILMRHKQMQNADIAELVFREERTVERWTQDFVERRMASLFSGLVGNEHAAKLTREQKAEIKQVLQQKPSEYGLSKEFWDVPQLKQYISARFGTVYESERSYHFLLEFGKLSFKYPDKFDIRRDAGLIIKRMQEIYSEIQPYLVDPSWEVFCSDETRMRLEAITRKAWLKKGERTVIKVERSQDYQNYLGFLNQKTYQCHVFDIAWGNQSEIIKATTEFLKLYPNKKIAIIWDNARCHKGEQMRKALSKGGALERVHLIPLPPYAPDFNPIEKVWNSAKDEMANHQCPTFAEMKHYFMRLVNNQIFAYQI